MATRNSSGIPAVGYARRSTDMQERSIPDQQAYVEKWAKEHGYRIVRWFIDDAISGTSAKGRNAFEQIIAAAENGRDFDTILCYDISRFSRGGTNETGYYLHRLRLAGVDVVFTADGIPEGDEGELIQGVKSWQARQYSVKLARDTIRGQISNIRERKSAPGGVAPYGYDKQHLTSDGKLLRTLRWMPDGSKQEYGVDGKLLRVIEPGVNIKKAKSDIIRYVASTPDRVAVIKRMFDLCNQGYGCHSIAQTFNNEGIVSPGGQKWNTARIAKLLRNPVYRGAIVWNRHTMGSLFGLDGEGKLLPKRGKGWKRNAEADWIISENVHEPLVSLETWNAAQRAVAKRRADAGKARPTKRTLLASLLVCKRCGHSFTTIRDRRWPGPTGEGYRTYACSGYHRYGKSVCGVTNVPGPALDAFVLQTIKRALLGDHETTKKAIDAFVAAVMAPKAATKRNSKADERELDLLNRKIKATVAMLADPTFDGLDELRTTLAELKAKRDALQAAITPAEPPATPALSEKELRTWALEQFARLDELATRNTIDLKDRQMVEAFVERIEINPETKTGVIYLLADLEGALLRSSTRGPIEDEHERIEQPRAHEQLGGRRRHHRPGVRVPRPPGDSDREPHQAQPRAPAQGQVQPQPGGQDQRGGIGTRACRSPQSVWYPAGQQRLQARTHDQHQPQQRVLRHRQPAQGGDVDQHRGGQSRRLRGPQEKRRAEYRSQPGAPHGQIAKRQRRRRGSQLYGRCRPAIHRQRTGQETAAGLGSNRKHCERQTANSE